MKAIKLLVMITMILISMIIFNCAATMNFSGDWSMNEEKTDMEGGTQMLPTKLTILHKGNNLSIESPRMINMATMVTLVNINAVEYRGKLPTKLFEK